MKNAIEEIECDKADDLLDALHPTRGSWRDNFGGWFFRGHGDSTWELLPSAFRALSWVCGFVAADVDPTSTGDVESWERLLMKRFYALLDQSGQQIPRGNELIRLLPTNFGSDWPWPDPVLEPLLALAQHHDVPTRLLDWTRSRKVAAYFAAIDALDKESQSLDVWALSHRFIEVFGDKVADFSCHIVKPLRHGNPNLHAQAGVFTLCRGRGIQADDTNKFIPLDLYVSVIAEALNAPDDMLPCLRRFRLPTSEARALLLDLHHDQIDAVTLFPGYVGVVRALREQRWLAPLLQLRP